MAGYNLYTHETPPVTQQMKHSTSRNRKPQEEIEWNRLLSAVLNHEYRENLIRVNTVTMIGCIQHDMMDRYSELAFQNSYDEYPVPDNL